MCSFREPFVTKLHYKLAVLLHFSFIRFYFSIFFYDNSILRVGVLCTVDSAHKGGIQTMQIKPILGGRFTYYLKSMCIFY